MVESKWLLRKNQGVLWLGNALKITTHIGVQISLQTAVNSSGVVHFSFDLRLFEYSPIFP
jgi:hypothetical protein